MSLSIMNKQRISRLPSKHFIVPAVVVRAVARTVVAGAFMALSGGKLYAQAIDEIVLIVNEQAITANEFKSLSRVQTIQSLGNLSAPQLGDPITEAIINDALMISHVARIAPEQQIAPAQLDAAIASLSARNNITPQQLIAQLNTEGVDVQVFIDSVRNRLLIQDVISQPLSSRIKVSNSEIQEHITNRPELKAQVNKEYELYHLVVDVTDPSDAAASAPALAAVRQAKAALENGADFQTVLNATAGARSSEDGGYLGWKSTKELPELFVWALEKLQADEVSRVLKSDNGLHLVKLIAKRDASRSVNEYQIRHILKRLAENQDPSAVAAKLRDIKKAINNGAGFAEVAARESDDRESAVNGGELGWVTLDSLVPRFAVAAATLTPNVLSEPIRSRFGMHLIQVLDIRETRREFSPVEARARQTLFAEKLNSRIDDLLNNLRSVAVIEVVN